MATFQIRSIDGQVMRDSLSMTNAKYIANFIRSENVTCSVWVFTTNQWELTTI